MKFAAFVVCAGMVLASALPLGAQTQPSPSTGTITLTTPNKQGPTGKAELTQQGSDVVITIHGLQDQTTAAILSGKCTGTEKPDTNGPAQPLKPLVNGTSQTVLANTTVAQLTSTPHAIVVQGGAQSILCGDVGAVTPGVTAPMPPAMPAQAPPVQSPPQAPPPPHPPA